jgi:hypothetical protein
LVQFIAELLALPAFHRFVSPHERD